MGKKEMIFKKKEELPPMSVSFGRMSANLTGSWRPQRLVIDKSKCTGCMICWKFCPEACIEPSKPPKIDLDYCKGCGICLVECPVDAISFVEEVK